MAEPRYTLSKQDVRTLKGVVRKVSAGKLSQRPLPTRRRTRNTKSGSAMQKAMATSAISAAVGLLEADYGGGTAQLINNQTGVDEGDPIDIDNPGLDGFDVRSLMWLNMSTSPPQIVSVFCTPVPE